MTSPLYGPSLESRMNNAVDRRLLPSAEHRPCSQHPELAKANSVNALTFRIPVIGRQAQPLVKFQLLYIATYRACRLAPDALRFDEQQTGRQSRRDGLSQLPLADRAKPSHWRIYFAFRPQRISLSGKARRSY